VAAPCSMPNLQRAVDHYGAIYAELERRQQAETAGMLSQIAELNRRIQREQAADAIARQRAERSPSSGCSPSFQRSRERSSRRAKA
jgi:hypothetical protein